MNQIKEVLDVASFNKYNLWKTDKVDGLFKLPCLISFNSSSKKVTKSMIIKHWLSVFKEMSFLNKMITVVTILLVSVINLSLIVLDFICNIVRWLYITSLYTIVTILVLSVFFTRKLNHITFYGYLQTCITLWLIMLVLIFMYMIFVLLLPNSIDDRYKKWKKVWKVSYMNKLLNYGLVTIWYENNTDELSTVDIRYLNLNELAFSKKHMINIVYRDYIYPEQIENSLRSLKIIDKFFLSNQNLNMLSLKILSKSKTLEEIILIKELAKSEYYKRKNFE